MAQLAPVVDKLEDVPEPARQFYVPKEGKFHVDLNGAPAGFVPATDLALANGKVVEFRDTNIALKKTVDELTPLKDKYKDIPDPVAAKLALDKVAELEKKGITKPDDVTAAVNAALEQFKTSVVKPLNDQLTAITTANTENAKRADQMTLRSKVSDLFTKAGGVPDALDFIVGKTNGVFIVEGGAVKAAPNQFSADKPGDPLTVEEWVTRQTKESPFAFKTSGGGGAAPAGGGGGGTPRAGVTVIKDPSPQDLGKYAADVKAGKVRFEYSENKVGS